MWAGEFWIHDPNLYRDDRSVRRVFSSLISVVHRNTLQNPGYAKNSNLHLNFPYSQLKELYATSTLKLAH